MSRLTGKVAVVTGASKGIGASIAKKLGEQGANVVVNYARDKKGADQVVSAITKSGAKAVAVQGDVSKPAEVKHLFAEALKAFGRVDVLVNNAGVYDFKPLDQVDEEHFHWHFDTNVLGLLLVTQEAAPLLGRQGGSVINVSSVVAKTPPAGGSVYSATKAAVDNISRSLAQELGPKNIRVNSLSPGLTDTEGLRSSTNDGPEFRNYAVSRTPLARVGTPEDIADAALFLASDDSRWITGETVLVGGGIRL
jgi:3-oxoacyl-[acyl-carrier protein] reductase